MGEMSSELRNFFADSFLDEIFEINDDSCRDFKLFKKTKTCINFETRKCSTVKNKFCYVARFFVFFRTILNFFGRKLTELMQTKITRKKIASLLNQYQNNRKLCVNKFVFAAFLATFSFFTNEYSS